MVSTLIAGILIWDGNLDIADGLILLFLLTLFLTYTFVAAKKGEHQEFENLNTDVGDGKKSKVWLMLIISFIVLLVSAKLVVWGGSELAGLFGVSDLLSIIDQWGQSDSPADINDDGVVDVQDILLIVGDWGPCE